MNNNQELIDQLEEAQSQILEAIETLKQVARTDDYNRGWAEAYIISHLETVATDEHGWMSSDQNITDWIKHLREQGECSDDPDAEPDPDDEDACERHYQRHLNDTQAGW